MKYQYDSINPSATYVFWNNFIKMRLRHYTIAYTASVGGEPGKVNARGFRKG